MCGKCGHALYYTSIAKAETLCSEQQNHEKTAIKNIFSVLFFINLLFIGASFNGVCSFLSTIISIFRFLNLESPQRRDDREWDRLSLVLLRAHISEKFQGLQVFSSWNSSMTREDGLAVVDGWQGLAGISELWADKSLLRYSVHPSSYKLVHI